MRTTIAIFSFFIILSFFGCNQSGQTENPKEIAGQLNNDKAPKLKRYDIKSGIVKYQTSIKGKVMGSTIDGSGTQELYFKDWGAVELKKVDEKKVTHINIFGQKKTEVDETHNIDKLDNGKSYHVDNDNKIIYVRNDPAMEMIKTLGEGDVVNTGEKMLEGMGGKKVGKEKVLGYNCDVWQIPGGKQWIYKGLPLKLEMTLMGITTQTTATEAKFNINVPNKYFKLPDYPIQEMQDFMGGMEGFDGDDAAGKKELEKFKNMSFDDYKKMIEKEDPEAFKNMSEEEMKMSFEIMQKMAKSMSK